MARRMVTGGLLGLTGPKNRIILKKQMFKGGKQVTDCIFCKMAQKEITPNIVFENENILAFYDINPKAPVHVLIISKKHIASLAEAVPEDQVILGEMQIVAAKIAKDLGIAENGYRLISNCRSDSGQEVPHLHYHLIGGHRLGPFW